MKQSIQVHKRWKCGRTKEELEKVGLTLERMAAYVPVNGPVEGEVVLEICSECLDEAGLSR